MKKTAFKYLIKKKKEKKTAFAFPDKKKNKQEWLCMLIISTFRGRGRRSASWAT